MLSTLSSFLLLSASIAGSNAVSDFEGPIVPGDSVSTAVFHDHSGAIRGWKPGRPTLFVIVGYWCDTWKVQLPRVERVKELVRGLPLDVRIVSIDGRWTELGSKRGFPPDYIDLRSQWSSSLGLDRVPYSFVVDRSGTVKWVKFGVGRSEEMCAALMAEQRETVNASSVALTFDDFPSPGDEKLLDLLQAEDVQATFFVIGEKLSAHSDLVERAIQEGHQIEIHGWEHDPKKVNAALCRRVLQNQFGVQPKFVRHPGSDVIFTLAGKKLLARTTNPYDYSRPGQNEITRRILNHIRKDGVILLHSGVDQTVRALPKVIRNLRRLNYRFELVR